MRCCHRMVGTISTLVLRRWPLVVPVEAYNAVVGTLLRFSEGGDRRETMREKRRTECEAPSNYHHAAQKSASCAWRPSRGARAARSLRSTWPLSRRPCPSRGWLASDRAIVYDSRIGLVHPRPRPIWARRHDRSSARQITCASPPSKYSSSTG